MPNEETHFTTQDRVTLIEVKTKLDRAIQDISNLGTNYAEKSDHLSLAKRVSSLESNITWVVRTIIGVIILALLSLVIINK